MGFTLNNIHTDAFGMAVTIKSMPYIPPKRQTTIEINGRDGQHIFEDGYNNITIEVACVIGGYDKLDRRKRARAIAVWLNKTGPLILDNEKDITYTVVKCVNNISATISAKEYREEFTVIFECDPCPKQTFYNDSLTWDTAESAWPYVNIPWGGYDRTFEVTPGQIINVENAGTYTALPIIIITGVAPNFAIGNFLFNNLSGTIYVDCRNMLIYSMLGGAKVNRMSDFDGEFLELKPGSNTFPVNGSIYNLTIQFDYKNTFL